MLKAYRRIHRVMRMPPMNAILAVRNNIASNTIPIKRFSIVIFLSFFLILSLLLW